MIQNYNRKRINLLPEKFEEMLMRSLVGGLSALPLKGEKIQSIFLRPCLLVTRGLRKGNYRGFAGNRISIGR